MHNLAELTSLNENEQRNLQRIRKLLQQNIGSTLVTIVGNYSLAQLFKLANNDKQVHEFLASSIFDTIWSERFNEVWPIGRDLDLQDGSTLFDRLLSYFLLGRYLAYENQPQQDAKQSQKLLHASIDLGNFHAMRLWLHRQIEQFALWLEDLKKLQTFSNVMKVLAVRHHTPGCIEAAYGYFKLGQFLLNLETKHVYHANITARFCFSEALKMALTAESLHDTLASKLAIINAYAGKGLIAGNNSRFTSFADLRIIMFKESNLNQQEYFKLLEQSSLQPSKEQASTSNLLL